jgi:predicted nucleic acid-binding protein
MKYALDTDMITYYLKGYESAIQKVNETVEKHDVIIPPFAYFEIKKWLLANNSKNKQQAFEKLFEKCGIDFIDKETLDIALSIYIKLRKNGITIDDGDLLIAAFCINNDYTLITNNSKHYESIENIQIAV